MKRQRWMRLCAAMLALLMSVTLPVEAWAATQEMQLHLKKTKSQSSCRWRFL